MESGLPRIQIALVLKSPGRFDLALSLSEPYCLAVTSEAPKRLRHTTSVAASSPAHTLESWNTSTRGIDPLTNARLFLAAGNLIGAIRITSSPLQGESWIESRAIRRF